MGRPRATAAPAVPPWRGSDPGSTGVRHFHPPILGNFHPPLTGLPSEYDGCGIARAIVAYVARQHRVRIRSSRHRPSEGETRTGAATRVWQGMVRDNAAWYYPSEGRFYHPVPTPYPPLIVVLTPVPLPVPGRGNEDSRVNSPLGSVSELTGSPAGPLRHGMGAGHARGTRAADDRGV